MSFERATSHLSILGYRRHREQHRKGNDQNCRCHPSAIPIHQSISWRGRSSGAGRFPSTISDLQLSRSLLVHSHTWISTPTPFALQTVRNSNRMTFVQVHQSHPAPRRHIASSPPIPYQVSPVRIDHLGNVPPSCLCTRVIPASGSTPLLLSN